MCVAVSKKSKLLFRCPGKVVVAGTNDSSEKGFHDIDSESPEYTDGITFCRRLKD